MHRKRARTPKTQSLAATAQTGNRLLAALPGAEARELITKCEHVELSIGEVLSEPGTRIRHVYFPIGGFISLISSIDQRPRLEVGLVGAEGMLGVSLLLGVNIAPLRALVQGAGPALRIEATRFSKELQQSPLLRQVLNRYMYVLMSQLAQMAACTHFHVLEARFARWLLMTRDCAHSQEFYLTQEFMAYMLGVRRVGITHAAGALQRRKLIHYTRGKLTILNDRGLEATSCTCYAATRNTYAAIIGGGNSGGRDPRRGTRKL